MKIKIYATSDTHGTITPYRYSDHKEMNMGLMKLSSLIHKDEHTLLIDNGDVLEGSPLDYVHHLKFEDQIHPMAKCFNAMNYDYINLGNHEFNFGKENVWKYIHDTNAICLTSNLFDKGVCFGKEYVIHEFDENNRIAIVGLTTQYIPNWEQPKNIVDMTFENVFDKLKQTADKIKKNEDVKGILVVYHGGFEKDLESGMPTENLTGENLGYKMCSEIEGIDVMISGHQHRSIAQFCHDTCVTQTAFNAKELAYIEWDLDTNERVAKLISADCEADETLYPLIEEEEKATQIYLDQPLGKLASGDLLVHDAFEARLHKHPLVSFLNRVQLDFTKADLSSVALFNDATGFNSTITMRDLVSTYVYPNTLCVVRMNGKTLKEYLEKCAEYFELTDGKIGVAPRFLAPKPAHYNYDMVDGVEYTIQVSNPVGSRIISLTRHGIPVKDEDSFTMVMSNYRAACGGDFFMIKDCEPLMAYQEDMVECLRQYIEKHPVIEINHQNNIKIIP